MQINSGLIRSGAVAILLAASLVLCLPDTALAEAASAEAAARQALADAGDGKVLSVRKKSDRNGNSYFEVQVIIKGNIRIFNIPHS